MMNRRDLIQDFFAVLILGLLFLFIDHRISIGILIGFGFSYLNYKLIEYRYNNLDKVNVLTYLGIFLSTFVLIVPLVISFLLPGCISWIGAVIGVLAIKAGIIIRAFLKRI